MSADLTLLQFDACAKFKEAFEADDTFRKTAGLSFDVLIDKKMLATTAVPPQGNKKVIIFSESEAPSEEKIGTMDYIMASRIRIITIIRTVEGKENAKDVVLTIVKHLEKVLWDKEWLGTGWLSHRKIGGGFAVPPTPTEAYHSLLFEVLSSVGEEPE